MPIGGFAAALPGVAQGLGQAAGGPAVSSSGPAISGNNTVVVPDNGLNVGAVVNALQGDPATGGVPFALPTGLVSRDTGQLGRVGVSAQLPGGAVGFSLNPILLIGGAAVAAFFLLR